MLIFRTLSLWFLLISYQAYAQPIVRVSGSVFNNSKVGLPAVTVIIIGQNQSTTTDEFGRFTIYSNSQKFSLKFNLLGYQSITKSIEAESGARLQQDVFLIENYNELEQVNITDKQNQLSNSTMLNLANFPFLPAVSGNMQSLLKTLPGVSVNNELSAQYSVRGGNFNENLVYINDIEINRPYLVRNAQQEGLSVINPDLVSTARFSAGGFEAKFGDKLSSVLDVKYEPADSNTLDLNLALLNSSISYKQKFNKGFLLLGIRYKNNSSLLRNQNNIGNYNTDYNDTQLMYQYNFNDKLNLNIFANYNNGDFKLYPTNRETQFGSLNTTMKLNVEYDGQEIDKYRTGGLALTSTYMPNPNMVVKFINSYFKSSERELIDLRGDYLLMAINNSTDNGNNFKGYGSHINYANNSIRLYNYNSEIKVDQNYNNHIFSWGVKFDHSKFNDRLNEYDYIENLNNSNIEYQNNINSQNALNIKYYSGYIQDSYSLNSKTDIQLGARASLNTINNQFLLSPRMLLAYRPQSNNKILRFSAGVYQQNPSYRTMLDISGNLNFNQKAQRTYNTSLGYEFAFDALNTRLKFYSEAYFKYSDRLIPYKIDNLSIRYLANQVSQGYTYGLDLSIGGELVKDLVSYFRISFMKANERIINNDLSVYNSQTSKDSFLKRPTDQRINFSFFFQDKLLNSPTYKIHINALYGSRLPIGPLSNSKYDDKFHIPAYRRLDVGFSNNLLDDAALKKSKFLEKNFSSVVLFAEVFNLLNIDNTISYLWLKDVNNVQYAVPNYLTRRQLNFKIIAKFKLRK